MRKHILENSDTELKGISPFEHLDSCWFLCIKIETIKLY